MSLESAKKFWTKINDDKDFQKKLEVAKDNVERVKMIKDAGFDFTKEELQQAVQAATGKKLSDVELDNVAGGAVLGAIVGAIVGIVGATAGSVVGSVVSSKVK